MKADDPLSPLRKYQSTLLAIIQDCDAEEIGKQFHPDLSPLGWHLGHCVFTESFWIREQVLGSESISDAEKSLYIPELSVKTTRGAAMPDKDALCAWAEATQLENSASLLALMENGCDSEYMQDNYLLFFLCQHYAQHIETAHYVLAQQQIQKSSEFGVQNVLYAEQLESVFVHVEENIQSIGAKDWQRHYDNECPAFDTEIFDFQIATRPINNAEYLGFIEDDGYLRDELWSDAGLEWLENNSDITCPQHWRQDTLGHYYGCDSKGCYELAANDAVSGINYYEAEALAYWANADLPHEFQWEAAVKNRVIEQTAEVWEWCRNSFMPYENFEAFPYDGYSLPWFDGLHISLRGGSPYTLPIIKRPSFRNFYQADKRHFPAGVRLIRD